MTLVTAAMPKNVDNQTMTRIEALRRVLFLKSLPETTLREIAQAGDERRLTRGEVLFSENERCIGLLVVLCGAVKVYKLDNRGRELTLAMEIPGGSIVELPLFDGGNYPASAEAIEADTIVLVVPRDRFRSLLTAHPEIGEQALWDLAVRMRRLMQMLEAQTLHSVQARLAAYLLSAAQGRTEFPLEETNEAIAGHLGTVREVVSRTLRSFKEGGLIVLRGRTVTIREKSSLLRIATSAEA
jgi:CRP-like cAMP-binding protein